MALKKASTNKKKDNSLRNAAITFGGVLLIYAMVFGFKSISGLVIGGLLSLAAASLIKIMTTPMKGLDAPGSSANIRPENVQDEYARRMVVQGLEMLEAMRKERNSINEQVFTRRINTFADAYAELLNRIVADAGKATYLRKMTLIYLPKTVELLGSYRNAKGQGTSYMEMSKTRENLLKTIDQLIEAAQTLQKRMVDDDRGGMEDTIEVLEDNLKADGLIEDEKSAELRESAAQAAPTTPLARQVDAAIPSPSAPPRVVPTQEAVRKPAPGMTMEPVAPAQERAPVPSLNVVPTASALQLEQGAPVLHVPGLFDEDEADKGQHKSSMF